jgi:hypothetical protein
MFEIRVFVPDQQRDDRIPEPVRRSEVRGMPGFQLPNPARPQLGGHLPPMRLADHAGQIADDSRYAD